MDYFPGSCILTTVILYGIEVQKLFSSETIINPAFGWTFVLAAVGGAFCLSTVLIHCRIAYDLLERRPYMEIS